jgi:hypothetical protein
MTSFKKLSHAKIIDVESRTAAEISMVFEYRRTRLDCPERLSSSAVSDRRELHNRRAA